MKLGPTNLLMRKPFDLLRCVFSHNNLWRSISARIRFSCYCVTVWLATYIFLSMSAMLMPFNSRTALLIKLLLRDQNMRHIRLRIFHRQNSTFRNMVQWVVFGINQFTPNTSEQNHHISNHKMYTSHIQHTQPAFSYNRVQNSLAIFIFTLNEHHPIVK